MRFRDEAWLPVLWSQSKTYYERHGARHEEWFWAPCYADIYADDFESVKKILEQTPPDVFAVSLYVWNYWLGHRAAAWVKSRWPRCFVITGGPHQYFQHDSNWFRDHTYLDASLPGECFGELCFQQVLDQLDDQGRLDPDTVTDLWWPQGRTRSPAQSRARGLRRDRKLFDYDWPSYAAQQSGINDYVRHAQQHGAANKLLAVLETTRGCPYGCTYCDWGGGINTTVVKKPLDAVYQDIEYLCGIDLKYLYLADANFGIFEQRDIEVMRYLCDQRRSQDSSLRLGYGGFAKTENRLETIKTILAMDLDNDLSSNREIKISMQSLDAEVLLNIDRKNISLSSQLAALTPLSRQNHYPIYVEMIMGLPGMTLDKFYQELDVLARDQLSVLWFEWILLPEAPAYHRSYRDRFGIETVIKTQGWSQPQSGGEHQVVVACRSYSTQDYLEMLVATSCYHALIRGGMMPRCQRWILGQSTATLAALIQDLVRESGVLTELQSEWQKILHDAARPATVMIQQESVYLGYYIPARFYFAESGFLQRITTLLRSKYSVPAREIQRDLRDLEQLRRTRDWASIKQDFYLYQNSGSILRPKGVFDRIKSLLSHWF